MAALGHPATVAALQQGREAAAIDEHQHLRRLLQVSGDQLQHLCRKTILQGHPAGVDQAENRRAGPAGALLQLQVFIAAAAGVVKAFKAGRSGAQHHRNLLAVGAGDAQVPGRVAEAILLLEGAVVLLIDDQNAGAGQRREDGGAGTDDNACLAIGGLQPGIEPLARRQPGVEHGHRAVEALAEAVDGLRC